MQVNFFKVDKETKVTTFLKSLKEKKNMQYIILEDNNSYVDLRDLALKNIKENEKLKSLEKPLTKIKTNNKLEIVKTMINSGEKVIYNETEDKFYDFVDAIKILLDEDFEIFDKKINECERAKVKKLLTLNLDDKIALARNIFLNNNINLLPVIEKEKVVGEVRPIDLLVSDFYIKNYGKKNFYDKNYEESIFNIPISNIYNPKPLTLSFDMKIKDVLKKIVEKKMPSIIVLDDKNNLYTIVSYRTIFKLIKNVLDTNKFDLELVNTDNLFEEDLAFIKRLAERTLSKISKISDYNKLRIIFKTYGNVDEKHKRKFEVNLSLSNQKNTITIKKETIGGTNDEVYNDKVKSKQNVVQVTHKALKALEEKVKQK